jgi:hypothetical protein
MRVFETVLARLKRKYPETIVHTTYIAIAPVTPRTSSCLLSVRLWLTLKYRELLDSSHATDDRKQMPESEKTKKAVKPAKRGRGRGRGELSKQYRAQAQAQAQAQIGVPAIDATMVHSQVFELCFGATFAVYKLSLGTSYSS